MPFVSVKQRSFLKYNEPEIYKRWKRKYGTKPVGKVVARTLRRQKKER